MENKIATFMLGLPGSGKSSFIKNSEELSKGVLVSADEIRVNHPDYDPKYPENIHQECIK
jgi:hypothetical protein